MTPTMITGQHLTAVYLDEPAALFALVYFRGERQRYWVAAYAGRHGILHRHATMEGRPTGTIEEVRGEVRIVLPVGV